jgi:hypothetical protein
VQRLGTALIALLAVLALGVAAGGFSPAGQPSLSSDTGLAGGGGPYDSVPRGGDSGGGGSGGGPVGSVVAAASSGLSPLFVAAFVAALMTCAGLALALTGDDERAPVPEDDPENGAGETRPRIEVTYGAPEDNVVVRAWHRLSDAVSAETAETPRETADRAAGHGFDEDAVDRLAESFGAVRYGDEPAEGRERDARDVLADVDGRDDE